MFGKRSLFNHPLLRVGVISLLGQSIIANAAPPVWWSQGNPPVVDPNASPDNHGMANIGQAKWMAKRAMEALREASPTLADQVEADLLGTGKPIANWNAPATNSEREAQRAPLLLGQLKAIAAPFYIRLNAGSSAWLANERILNSLPDTGSHFPWTVASNDDANLSPATIGQLKAVFSLRFETLAASIDSDGDGLSNLSEVLTHHTDPFKADTDEDGLLDGWEVVNSLDPNDDGTININNGGSGDPDYDGLTNSEEQDLGSDPNDADSDDDGITDGGEDDQGTDPNDPEDTPDAEWFILTGDLEEAAVKTRSRTVTIPAGESRVITVVVASDEYPDWTGDESEFNDTLEWNIQPSEGDALEGSIDVNARHDEWEEAETEGRECKGFSPAHVETGMTLTAPDNAALTVEIELSATNIGDGILPSTVLVGILPVVPVEFFPQLLDGDGVAIAGSENPRTEPGQTNGMTEENPVANRIAHREMRIRIVDGEVLEGKELTWTMDPLYVHPDGQEPAFRGEWTRSTNHNTYFETSAHYGAYDFATIAAQPTPLSATTTIDEDAKSALRINLPPIGFNQGRVKIEVEDFQGDPAKVADMEVPAVIVIDPGHGGADSGAVGSDGTTLEKNLTLAYGQDLQTELRDELDDLAPFHRVLITRNADVFIDLAPRPAIARDAGADVFASIHFNSGGAAARGTETFVERLVTEASPGNPGDNHNVDEDEALATPVNTETFDAVAASDQGANNRGVQRAGKLVTRDAFNGNDANYHPVRTCLIEVEFISNAATLKSIIGANGEAIRGAFAEGVGEAIVTDIQEQPN